MQQSNILKGDVESISWNELKNLGSDYVYIDMRNKSEVAGTGVFKGAIHIPLNDLRERLHELDKSKKYIAYCATGLRSYIGCRILTQHGFSVKNLSGSYTTLMYVKDKIGQERKYYLIVIWFRSMLFSRRGKSSDTSSTYTRSGSIETIIRVSMYVISVLMHEVTRLTQVDLDLIIIAEDSNEKSYKRAIPAHNA